MNLYLIKNKKKLNFVLPSFKRKSFQMTKLLLLGYFHLIYSLQYIETSRASIFLIFSKPYLHGRNEKKSELDIIEDYFF